MIRSPGIYFETDKRKNLISTIIPSNGYWITTKIADKQEKPLNKILIDSEIRFGNYKLNTILLLQYLGLTNKKIIYYLNNNEKNQIKNYKKIKSKMKKSEIKKIYVNSQKIKEKLKIQEQILGKIGRIKLNKKIYKSLFWKNEEQLKEEDLLGCLNYLINRKID